VNDQYIPYNKIEHFTSFPGKTSYAQSQAYSRQELKSTWKWASTFQHSRELHANS